MGKYSEDLESDDLRVVIRLMPGEIISELIKALASPRYSRLGRARTKGFDRGNFDDLLTNVDESVRRLAAHKVFQAFREPPSYSEALRRLCLEGGVEIHPDDSAAEMERRFLVRTYENRDGERRPRSETGFGWGAPGGEALSAILGSVLKTPAVRRAMDRAKRNPKAAVVLGVIVAVVTLAAVGNRLTGPAYAKLEDSVRIVGVFRQAKLFELLAEEAS